MKMIRVDFRTPVDHCQPVCLESDRVILRDLRAGDFTQEMRDLTAPDAPWHKTNGPYFGLPTPQDHDHMLAAWKSRTDKLPGELECPREILAITTRERPDAVVGTVNWYYEDEATDWRRMGICVWDQRLWGTGIGTQALAMFTTYLFAHCDALRLDFATYSGNPGMIAIGQKLGFVEEGRMRNARRWHGGVHDAVVMGILREEWESSPFWHE